jgi:hypothetical protein
LNKRKALATGSTARAVLPIQVRLVIHIDSITHTLQCHLTNVQHVRTHPVFGDQVNYYLRLTLFDEKLLRKCHNQTKQHRPHLQWTTWRKQQEQTTRSNMTSNIETAMNSVCFVLDDLFEHRMIH